MIQPGQRKPPLAALLLAAILLWVPIPIASVGPTGLLIVRLGALLAIVFVTLEAGSEASLRQGRGPLALLAGVPILGLVQILPWPARVAGVVSPEHLALREQAWSALGAGEPPPWLPLTLTPDTTMSASLTWTAVAAVFGTALVVGRVERHRRALALVLLAGGALQIGVGVVRSVAGDEVVRALGIPLTTGRFQGTFANANHLALYFEILLAITFAWVLGRWSLDRGRGRSGAVGNLGPGLVWLALFVGLAFTGSRAGLLAALVGCAVQGLVVARQRGQTRWLLAAPAVVVVGLAAVLAIDARLGLGRFVSRSVLEDLQSRASVWTLAVALWRRFPWSGAGLGSFREAFPLVQPGELAGSTWDRAHNDLLELLVGGGLVAAVLLVLGLLGLVAALRRRLRRGDGGTRVAALAAVGAVAAAGVHELFDFGLTIPANAVTLAAVVGLAVGAGLKTGPSRSRARPSRDRGHLRRSERPPAGGGSE